MNSLLARWTGPDTPARTAHASAEAKGSPAQATMLTLALKPGVKAALKPIGEYAYGEVSRERLHRSEWLTAAYDGLSRCAKVVG